MTKPVASDSTDYVCGKTKRASRLESERPAKKNRTEEVIKAIGEEPVTERHILEEVGDNRYTREILRRLMAQEIVTRVGKGGSNDPYLYRVVKDMCIADMLLVDPALEVRLMRIESKITALLREEGTTVTEKQIRSFVGDNTGTGKALRRLVNSGRVIREGRGGAGNPYTYSVGDDCPSTPVAATLIPPNPAPSSASSSISTWSKKCSNRVASKAAVAAPATPTPPVASAFAGRLRARPAIRVTITEEITTDDDEDDEDEEKNEREEDVQRTASVATTTPTTPATAPSMLMDLPSETQHASELLANDDVHAHEEELSDSSCSSDYSDSDDDDDEARDRLIGINDAQNSEDDIHVSDADENYAFTAEQMAIEAPQNDELEIGGVELCIVGRSCGIVVGSVEEAIALSHSRRADQSTLPPVVDAALAMSWLA